MRFLLLLALLAAVPVQAQEGVRFNGLRAEARAAASRGAGVLDLPTRRVAGLRVDVRSGAIRGDYDPPAFSATGLGGEAAARSYLSQFAGRYGLAADLADLRLTRVTEGRYDQHVTFEQTVDVGGEVLPVFATSGAGEHDGERTRADGAVRLRADWQGGGWGVG